MEVKKEKIELATFGGGSFWFMEAIFNELRGVQNVTSGYAAGSSDNPNYREVASGLTGHAEVIQVQFNADVISFEDILRVFFTCHNPTLLHQQGRDVGTQYRSIVLYHDDIQRDSTMKIAWEMRSDLKDPICTEVKPFKKFYKAESYHQNYYAHNPNKPYCAAVISPKLRRLRNRHADKVKQLKVA